MTGLGDEGANYGPHEANLRELLEDKISFNTVAKARANEDMQQRQEGADLAKRLLGKLEKRKDSKMVGESISSDGHSSDSSKPPKRRTMGQSFGGEHCFRILKFRLKLKSVIPPQCFSNVRLRRGWRKHKLVS